MRRVLKLQGTIKFFNHRQGYGFIYIKNKDGLSEEVFFHRKNVFVFNDETIFLNEGDKVSFNLIETFRGKKAINVLKLNKKY